MEYYCNNAKILNILMTHKPVYCDTLWHNIKNVRIFPDGELFTRRMPYINTVRFYLRVICSDREFILSVTFLILIYLKEYQGWISYGFPSWQACKNYGKKREFNIIHQWSCHIGKSVVRSIYMLGEHHGGWYLLHPSCWLFHLSSSPT